MSYSSFPAGCLSSFSSKSFSGPALLGVVALIGLFALTPTPASADGVGFGISLQPVASGFSEAIAVRNAGDGSGRLFVVEQAGTIDIIENGSVLATPFLEIQGSVSFGGEQGLLGLAFHPNYSSNGFFYVNYINSSGDTVISRFSVSAANPNVADPNSEHFVLIFNQPFSNHNGGDIHFGSDGFLYIASGDGGSSGDPGNRAQTLSNLLGKILRIDVNSDAFPAEPNRNYAIPAGNPFIGGINGEAPEIWVYGLRNPWRFSFDRDTGDMLIGDVGQNVIEEIDFLPAAAGGGANFGWRLMEGTSCFNPSTNCNNGTLTLPVAEYNHGSGCSVTGGFVYRGSDFPQMDGYYFYADFCTGFTWVARPGCLGSWYTFQIADQPFNVSSFGEDEAGELYVVQRSSSGTVYRVTATAPSTIFEDGLETGIAPWEFCVNGVPSLRIR